MIPAGYYHALCQKNIGTSGEKGIRTDGALNHEEKGAFE